MWLGGLQKLIRDQEGAGSDVSGYTVTVWVELIDHVAAGDGPDSRFISGEIRVRWGSKRRASTATE